MNMIVKFEQIRFKSTTNLICQSMCFTHGFCLLDLMTFHSSMQIKQSNDSNIKVVFNNKVRDISYVFCYIKYIL